VRRVARLSYVSNLTMSTTVDEVFQTIVEAAARSDSESLRKAAYDLETLLMYGDSAVATDIAERVIELLRTPEFRAAYGVWHVLFSPRNDLEKISEENKRRLFMAMVDAYNAFADWMSCFITSELTEYFPTAWALGIVRNRLANSEERGRRYVPHAFEHIARAATDDEVAREPFESLVSMLRDESPNVGDEARTSVLRIANTNSDLAVLAKQIVGTEPSDTCQ
jgi:hypothetical protein